MKSTISKYKVIFQVCKWSSMLLDTYIRTYVGANLGIRTCVLCSYIC